MGDVYVSQNLRVVEGSGSLEVTVGTSACPAAELELDVDIGGLDMARTGPDTRGVQPEKRRTTWAKKNGQFLGTG